MLYQTVGGVVSVVRFVVTPESSAASEFTNEADAPENIPDDQNDAHDSAVAEAARHARSY